MKNGVTREEVSSEIRDQEYAKNQRVRRYFSRTRIQRRLISVRTRGVRHLFASCSFIETRLENS